MRVATPEQVLTVLGIQQSTGSLLTAGAALDATFPQLEAMLESSVVLQHRKDLFDLGSGEVTRPLLRLASGLVTTEEDVVVEFKGDALVAGDDYTIDYRRGVVHTLGTYTAGKHAFSVDYYTGYSAAPGSTILADVPTAIVQASIDIACAYLLLSPANSAKDKARFLVGHSVDGFQRRARQSLAPLARPRANHVWESLSEVLED